MLCFFWAQQYLKACPYQTKFFKSSHSVPQYFLNLTVSYFVTVRKLQMSGPQSQHLGSEGHWCQRSTESLWNFLVSRSDRDLQEEFKCVEKDG